MNAATSVLQWDPIKTALLDSTVVAGEPVILLAHGMIVEARFCPGEWSHSIDGSEYDGPVWSCFDDAIQFEIEELGRDEYHHGPVTHWAQRPALAFEDSAA